jgi:hypothetical protein
MTSPIALATGRQNEQTVSQPVAARKKLQPWLTWSIGLFLLAQAFRLIVFSDSLGLLVGFGLLFPVPGCFYLGWRDYRRQPTPTRIPAFRAAACEIVDPPAAA